MQVVCLLNRFRSNLRNKSIIDSSKTKRICRLMSKVKFPSHIKMDLTKRSNLKNRQQEKLEEGKETQICKELHLTIDEKIPDSKSILMFYKKWIGYCHGRRLIHHT